MRTVFSHGAVIIVDPKNNVKFKVNGQRLKPFLTTEPMTPDDSVRLFLPRHTPNQKKNGLFVYMLTPSTFFDLSFASSPLAGPSQRVTSFFHPIYCIRIYIYIH